MAAAKKITVKKSARKAPKKSPVFKRTPRSTPRRPAETTGLIEVVERDVPTVFAGGEDVSDAFTGGKREHPPQAPEPEMDWMAHLPPLTFQAPKSFLLDVARGALAGTPSAAMTFMLFADDGGYIGHSFWYAYAKSLESGIPNEKLTKIAHHRLQHWITCAEVAAPVETVTVRRVPHPVSDFKGDEPKPAWALDLSGLFPEAHDERVRAREQAKADAFDPFLDEMEKNRLKVEAPQHLQAMHLHHDLAERTIFAIREQARELCNAICFAGWLVFAGLLVGGAMLVR